MNLKAHVSRVTTRYTPLYILSLYSVHENILHYTVLRVLCSTEAGNSLHGDDRTVGPCRTGRDIEINKTLVTGATAGLELL